MSRKIQRFFSQPFFVAEPFTGKEGRYVAVEDTVKGFEAILGGELDKVSEVAFNNMGTIDEVLKRARKKCKEESSWLHIYLEMVSPQNIFFSGNARQIILPGLDGAYGVLPNHEPMVTAMMAGVVRYQDQEGTWHEAVVSDGCVEVMPERVILLAATIERPEEIDRNRALAAKRRAEERMRQQQSQREYYQTQAALARALARLKAKSPQ